ncbi:MAG: bifunctional glutamate N-acetyltransferase/amino-acid acetyltransferase ArgJ [Alphaproteobacteria bacterium]|nr:bifunctional glutamate N-acetyltransferase/amino-acid acetyltransferase ArgJ [Alphaproteobacteria bacterium]
MSIERSPLAPASFPAMPVVAGVELAGGAAGVRYADRPDLALMTFAPGTTVGGVFTRSHVPGHPIVWCRQILERGRARALVVNAGNANVLNGGHGDAAVQMEATAAAGLLNAAPEEIFVASTGVIGEPLPVEKIVRTLPDLHERLSPDGWEAAAEAIRTTNTFAKGSFAKTTIGGRDVTIAGIAKGSGMIQPDMATMLAFIATDAGLPAPVLQQLVEEANEEAFRKITVDSDTSTSDMLLMFATGQAVHPAPLDASSELLSAFRPALLGVACDLAKQVVRDGEGISKFIQIAVEGAISDESARIIAHSVANSPLVKTAIAGEDANWGRIVAALGKAYQPIELSALGITVGGHVVATKGARLPGLDEQPIAEHLKGREIDITITVGPGDGQATVWTSDLTHDYITINADYRS